ncbi:hypothetical protein P8452_32306 [Trifolium repens]|nr:hypothetical protein P8452_32306 [Trifolium repens]
MVVLFNTLLRSLVDQLNKEYTNSIFVYGNTYEVFNELIVNPDSYGFTISDKACCGFGRNKAQNIAVSKIMASKTFNGPPSVCHPINVLQMAQKHLPSNQSNASIMN